MPFSLPTHLDMHTLHEAFRFAAQLHDAEHQRDVAQTALTTIAAILPARRWTLSRVSGTVQEAGSCEIVKLEVLATHDTEAEQHEAATASDAAQPGDAAQLTDTEQATDAEQLSDMEHRFALSSVTTARVSLHTEAGENLIVVPLISHDRVIAILTAMRDLSGGAACFTDENAEILHALAVPLALALNNAVRIAEAERLSRTDDLTSLHNARYMRDCLLNEIKRARRYDSNVAVLFLDIDNFKNVNDSHGHIVGSHTLIEVAKAILVSVRDTDIVARYGGDEFVVVLPETTADRALQVAERIRATLAQTIFTGGRNLNLCLTASFGVAAYPAHANSAQELVVAADRAMYDAKGALKNCVRRANFERFEFPDEKLTSENFVSLAS